VRLSSSLQLSNYKLRGKWHTMQKWNVSDLLFLRPRSKQQLLRVWGQFFPTISSAKASPIYGTHSKNRSQLVSACLMKDGKELSFKGSRASFPYSFNCHSKSRQYRLQFPTQSHLNRFLPSSHLLSQEQMMLSENPFRYPPIPRIFHEMKALNSFYKPRRKDTAILPFGNSQF